MKRKEGIMKKKTVEVKIWLAELHNKTLEFLK